MRKNREIAAMKRLEREQREQREAEEELRRSAEQNEVDDEDEIEREMMGFVEPIVQSTEAEEDNLNLDEMMEEMEQD